MKKFLISLIVLLCLVALFSCNKVQKSLDEEFGFCQDDFIVIEEIDTHGGFNGDGNYYLTLDCSKNMEKINELITDWNKLPFSEELGFIMYGGSKDKTHYGAIYGNEKGKTFPQIENGYYKILDRNNGDKREVVDDLGYHASNNFTIAVYDADGKLMYYFEFDM